MRKNDFRQSRLYRVGARVLVIGSVALAGNSDAATAVGMAAATVLESVSVNIIVPATVGTAPVLSGTIFTIESFTGSLSLSGPLLRVGSPRGAVMTDAQALSGTGGAGALSAANSATVTVTRNADGSLRISGGSGLTFAVSQSGVGVVNIEYN